MIMTNIMKMERGKIRNSSKEKKKKKEQMPDFDS